MKNKKNIIIALASLSFFLIVYFFISTKEVEIPKKELAKNSSSKDNIVSVDLVALRGVYKETVKRIYGGLQDDINKKSMEKSDVDEELETFKSKLMALTVPDEYRVFHLSFIMLIDKALNNKITFGDDFQIELNKIRDNNPWLK